MGTVNPTLAFMAEFERKSPDDDPIVMLNLLRFRDEADYGPAGPAGKTGREAYATYSRSVLPLLFEVGGQPLWMGDARAMVIGPGDESWDEVLLVQYPSRSAFLRMVKSPAYQAIMHHRTAALSDSRLVETRARGIPRWVLGAARAAVRVRALLFPKITA